MFDAVVIERQWFRGGIDGLHEPLTFDFIDVDRFIYDRLDPACIQLIVMVADREIAHQAFVRFATRASSSAACLLS